MEILKQTLPFSMYLADLYPVSCSLQLFTNLWNSPKAPEALFLSTTLSRYSTNQSPGMAVFCILLLSEFRTPVQRSCHWKAIASGHHSLPSSCTCKHYDVSWQVHSFTKHLSELHLPRRTWKIILTSTQDWNPCNRVLVSNHFATKLQLGL